MQDFTFTLNNGSIAKTVYPIFGDKTYITYQKKADNFYYVPKIDGKFTFVQDDFDFIVQSKNALFSFNGYNSINHVFFNSTFTIYDCELDFDNNICKVTPLMEYSEKKIEDILQKKYQIRDLDLNFKPADLRVYPLYEWHILGTNKIYCFTSQQDMQERKIEKTDFSTDTIKKMLSKRWACCAVCGKMRVYDWGTTPDTWILCNINAVRIQKNGNTYITEWHDSNGYFLRVYFDADGNYSVDVGNSNEGGKTINWQGESMEFSYGSKIYYIDGLYFVWFRCAIYSAGENLLTFGDICENGIYNSAEDFDYTEPGSYNFNASMTIMAGVNAIDSIRTPYPTSEASYWQPPSNYKCAIGYEFWEDYKGTNTYVSMWLLNNLTLNSNYAEARQGNFVSLPNVIRAIFAQENINYTVNTDFCHAQNQRLDLWITQKTNLMKAYNYAATAGEITLQDILNLYQNFFKVAWVVIENVFYLVYYKWYENGMSYDPSLQVKWNLETMRAPQHGKNWGYGQNIIKKGDLDLTAKYSFAWADAAGRETFLAGDIQFNDKNLDADKSEEIKTGVFTTDIGLMMQSPESFTQDGFALVDVLVQQPKYIVIGTDNNGIQNGRLGLEFIQKVFWNIDTNGNDFYNFKHELIYSQMLKKTLSQEVKFYLNDFTEINNLHQSLIKTHFGYSQLESIKVNINDLTAEASIYYRINAI